MIIFFMVSLWTPLIIAMTTPAREVSLTEKRKLAPLPTFEWGSLSNFPQNFEAYYNDHFGLREQLLQGYNYYQFSLLNISSSNRVIVGKNGWLFQNGGDHVKDIRNIWPFSPAELQHWANILSLKHQWLQERGIQYIFMVTPSKHLIYPEQLPKAFQPAQPQSRADQLVTYLQAHTQVPVIDMRKALSKEKKKLRPYHKTDTHWNPYGAFIGYRETMRHLKKQLSSIKTVPLKRKHFKMVERPGGDLAQSLNLERSIKEEVPEPLSWDASCLQNSTLQGEQNDASRNKQWFATTCDKKKYRVVMFRDSYSLAMMPYLSQSFQYIYYIPHSPVRLKNMQEIILQQNPDIVIEQRTTRWLRTPEG